MAWVVFDYGGVVSTAQPAADVAAMAATAGSSVPRFSDAYWEHRHDYDVARLAAGSYWQAVADQLDRSWDGCTTARLVALDIASWSHVRPATVRLAGDVAATGHRLALLSNAPREFANHLLGLPVARHFEHLIFSCDLRAAKPDPGCFRSALARLEAEPANVIFIDDRLDNVAAAAQLGIHAIHFSGPEAARAALQHAGAIRRHPSRSS